MWDWKKRLVHIFWCLFEVLEVLTSTSESGELKLENFIFFEISKTTKNVKKNMVFILKITGFKVDTRKGKTKIEGKKDLKNTKNPENWNLKPNSTDRISAIGQPTGPTIMLTPKCIPAE